MDARGDQGFLADVNRFFIDASVLGAAFPNLSVKAKGDARTRNFLLVASCSTWPS